MNVLKTTRISRLIDLPWKSSANDADRRVVVHVSLSVTHKHAKKARKAFRSREANQTKRDKVTTTATPSTRSIKKKEELYFTYESRELLSH